jgi:hypothetical protein
MQIFFLPDFFKIFFLISNSFKIFKNHFISIRIKHALVKTLIRNSLKKIHYHELHLSKHNK